MKQSEVHLHNVFSQLFCENHYFVIYALIFSLLLLPVSRTYMYFLLYFTVF